MENFNLRVLKEPLGLIRAIQFILSIFAFATTADFKSHSSFGISCNKSAEIKQVDLIFKYPFRLSDIPLSVTMCDGNKTAETLVWDFSSSAEYFVATGVLAFLFSLSALIMYIFFWSLYSNKQFLPIFDLAVSLVLTIFWLAASSAWASGVSYLKYYTNPDHFMKLITVCNDVGECKTKFTGNFASLNVSLVNFRAYSRS
ncbi:synaptophysin-like isoform X2 [Tachypleus tridentatus]|uniref:synaptophysin-like isoform X2 n=1 Tax=Tachypleus tridentatus TaxID=6853 RepID=UPI003FD60023